MQLVLHAYENKHWFQSVRLHMLQCDPTANHVLLLINADRTSVCITSVCYVAVQLQHWLCAFCTELTMVVHGNCCKKYQ